MEERREGPVLISSRSKIGVRARGANTSVHASLSGTFRLPNSLPPSLNKTLFAQSIGEAIKRRISFSLIVTRVSKSSALADASGFANRISFSAIEPACSGNSPEKTQSRHPDCPAEEHHGRRNLHHGHGRPPTPRHIRPKWRGQGNAIQYALQGKKYLPRRTNCYSLSPSFCNGTETDDGPAIPRHICPIRFAYHPKRSTRRGRRSPLPFRFV